MGMVLHPELERKCLELAGALPTAVPVDLDAGEKEFQADVVKLAKRNGWLYYHTHDSRKSVRGFPDLVLLRERLLIRELKTETGETTPAQDEWLAAMRRVGIDAGVWRPRDWNLIVKELA